ncbi:hypothetical protein KUTeg_006356 [Tegillarca granosa]|uniref:Phospholipid scramblase n=1 Tax=Tegillarca granosa TaxID=220873 RepID=A0ABQ9FG81_TEGGR|nr:hypothetical protein KUTeg_006356 [Tegillarca granosa]
MQQPPVSPEGVQMMPPPSTMVVVPQGLPPGLAYLQSLDKINIHQIFDLVEDTDCMTRQCCGPARPFLMNITDNQGQPLLSLDRPFRVS